MAYIPPALRERVVERAQHRCEYCQSQKSITGGPLHIEHVFPEALGGLTTSDNLALSCARCNLQKGVRTHHRDLVSERLVPLFNPRIQKWTRHFIWRGNGTHIQGQTQSGRATVSALNMNHPTIVKARSMWIRLGIHLPY